MEELAIECGYYDQPHMTRYFKKFAGTTPEAYLREMEEKEYGGMKNEFIKD